MSNRPHTLINEHDRIRGMLDAFEGELDVFERAEQPDYDILGSSIAYCRDYLDAWHHPKEEALLERLRRRDPDKAEACGAIAGQHAELAGMTKTMVDIFDSVQHGTLLVRNDVVGTGRALLQAYRSHLEWEEAQFLPIVEKTLSPADWAAIATRFGDAADPLACNPVDARYRALFDAIADAKAEGRSEGMARSLPPTRSPARAR